MVQRDLDALASDSVDVSAVGNFGVVMHLDLDKVSNDDGRSFFSETIHGHYRGEGRSFRVVTRRDDTCH